MGLPARRLRIPTVTAWTSGRVLITVATANPHLLNAHHGPFITTLCGFRKYLMTTHKRKFPGEANQQVIELTGAQ
jgi:hypothetical protein